MSFRTEQLAEGVTLILGDCREVLPTLGSFDFCVTSPPYDGMRAYGGDITTGTDCLEVIGMLAAGLSDGGVIVWNVADQTVDGSESGTSFKQALHAKAVGLRLHDTMIYCKEGVTFPDANRYHPAFEYMFVFSKGAPCHFNGIKDWKNKWGGAPMHGTDRQQDGSTTRINGHGRPILEMGLRRNWWVMSNPYIGETDGHPAPMPVKMASDHIETWTVPGALVVDPFLGSGTSGLAAIKLNRRFVGIEINPDYFEIALRRLSAAVKEPNLFAGAA